MPAPPPGRPRPLLATADPGLLDDLLRLCAAAGVEPLVAHDAAAARLRWPTAPCVVVGGDLAAELARHPPARREGVVLVGLDLDDAGVWALGVALGAERVVFLPDSEAWVAGRVADAVDRRGPDAPLVGVLGGRGGAGASTLAVALAVTAARAGRGTTLVDADPLGGGLDLALGHETAPGLRWPALSGTRGRLDPRALQDGLPRAHGLSTLSWDRGDQLSVPVEAVEAVLAAARQTSDLVVVDLPRRLDAAAEVVLARSDAALLVVPAEVRAVAAAARVATSVRGLARLLGLVVRGPAPTGLRVEDVAHQVGLPLVGSMDAEPRLDEDLDHGLAPGERGRGPLAGFCRGFLGDWLVEARGARRTA